jgi:peptidoglycan/xylan/chitin deacetylase (PgdA/CDA1 family)
MFKYSTVSILFFITAFILLIGYQQIELSLLYLLIPISLYIVSLVLGSIFIRFNFYFNSLNKSKTEAKEIAITFDDGPHPVVTPKLLHLLDSEDVKASFFLVGKNIEGNEGIINKISEGGHIIGNHSFSHHNLFDLFSASKIAAEIGHTNFKIKEINRIEPLFFRPPYGVTNPLIKKAIQQTEMVSVGWSVHSLDTVNSAKKVLRKLKKNTKPGSVVLLHDTNEKILEIMSEYLSWLKENDFKIVSLDKLFSIEIYENPE